MSSRSVIAIKFNQFEKDPGYCFGTQILDKYWGDALILLKFKGKVVARAKVIKIEHGVQMCLWRDVEYKFITIRIRRKSMFQNSFAPFFKDQDGTAMTFNFQESI